MLLPADFSLCRILFLAAAVDRNALAGDCAAVDIDDRSVTVVDVRSW